MPGQRPGSLSHTLWGTELMSRCEAVLAAGSYFMFSGSEKKSKKKRGVKTPAATMDEEAVPLSTPEVSMPEVWPREL